MFKKRMSRLTKTDEFGILIPLLVILLVTGLFNRNFLTVTNFTAMFKSIPFIALTSLGASFVLMTGNVDISVGKVAGLGGMVFSFCLVAKGLSLGLSLALGLTVGILAGLINGFLVAVLMIPDFVATMGTYYIFGGARFLLNKGYPLNPLPGKLPQFAADTPLGISWPFWIMIALFVVVGFMQRKTTFGRHLYTVGDNREVAKLAGAPVLRIRMIAYTVGCAFAALAGILCTIDLNNGVPQTGDGWEFKAIASCAVGGVSLAGGKGSAVGTAIGVMIVFVLNNALIMLNVPATLQTSFTGVILAGSVLFDLAKQKKKVAA